MIRALSVTLLLFAAIVLWIGGEGDAPVAEEASAPAVVVRERPTIDSVSRNFTREQPTYDHSTDHHLLSLRLTAEAERQTAAWEAEVAAAEEARRAQEEAAAKAQAAQAAARPRSASAPSGGAAPAPAPSGSPNFQALAQCESGMRNVANPSGKYRGYFQFDLQTWASVGMSGDPMSYSYAVQEEGARRLYASRGRSPWPHCGRYL